MTDTKLPLKPPSPEESEASFKELVKLMNEVILKIATHDFKAAKGEFFILSMGNIGYEPGKGLTIRRTVSSNLKLSQIRDLVFPENMPDAHNVTGFHKNADGSLREITDEEREKLKAEFNKEARESQTEAIAEKLERMLMDDPVQFDKSKLN